MKFVYEKLRHAQTKLSQAVQCKEQDKNGVTNYMCLHCIPCTMEQDGIEQCTQIHAHLCSPMPKKSAVACDDCAFSAQH